MRDEETGTYWQQVSGRAISGPLKGSTLTPVHSDELSFALWVREQPQGVVLAPVEPFARKYEKKDWEAQYAKLPTVISAPPQLGGRELVIGINLAGTARAFPFSKIKEQKVVADYVGATPIVLVLGPDRASVRAFENRLPATQKSTDFYRKASATETDFGLVDSESGGEWDFQGCAVSGTLKGACLRQIDLLKDYWFDWAHYNPNTTVYTR